MAANARADALFGPGFFDILGPYALAVARATMGKGLEEILAAIEPKSEIEEDKDAKEN